MYTNNNFPNYETEEPDKEDKDVHTGAIESKEKLGTKGLKSI